MENKKVGRPSLGETRKVSITLPEDVWRFIDARKEELGVSQSETLRTMLEAHWGLEEQTGQ